MIPEWVDDAVCEALYAAEHGRYDGMPVVVHLKHLLDRIREANDKEEVVNPSPCKHGRRYCQECHGEDFL